MRGSLALVLGIAALALASCGTSGDEPGLVVMPEMFHSVPYDSHDPNPVLRHGQTLQHAPAGTVSRGFVPMHHPPGPEGAAAAGRDLTNPIAPSSVEVRRGARLYASTCAVCHGPRGAGDGPIVPPFPNPPALSAGHARALPDGQVFHIITHGQGIMPPHGSQLSPTDRWRLVLFVRWLQDPTRPVVRPAGAS